MTFRQLRPKFVTATARFASASEGSGVITFGMAALPVMLLVGSAIDYGAASARKASLQAAVDAAALAAVQSSGIAREQVASRVLFTSVDARVLEGLQFSLQGTAQGVTLTARSLSPTGVMRLAGITEIAVNASASARAARRDASCIVAMARNIPVGETALNFNGSPSVSLTGCGMMSNASAACSGFSTNAPYTAAVGTVSGACPNQMPGYEPLPDVYEPLKKEIQLVCNGMRMTTNWRAGAMLPLPNMIAVTRSNHVEYHLCGDVRVEGVGALNTLAFPNDAVIVIENGDIDIRSGADVSATRMTFVLTGDNVNSHRVTYPNGPGNGAKLSLSPSVNVGNPWRGMSIYQDPRLTQNVDMVWSPAATFRADGVVYLGPAALMLNGSASSNTALCTKFVTNSLTANGNIDFKYSKDSTACGDLGVSQWEAPPSLTP